MLRTARKNPMQIAGGGPGGISAEPFRHRIRHDGKECSVPSLHLYRFLPVEARITLVKIQMAFIIRTDFPEHALYPSGFVWKNGCHAASCPVGAEREPVTLQTDRSDRLRIGTAEFHLFVVHVGTIGKIQFTVDGNHLSFLL